MADEKKEEKKPVVTISPTDKPIFYWQATEFESHDKPNNWLLYIVLVAIVLLAILLYMRLWLGAAVVVAACFALYSQSRSRGKKRNYAVYDQGVTVDDKVYTFDQFKSFWVFSYQDRAIIRLEQLKRLALPVEMPVNDENPEQVRLFLSKHLPEAEDRGEDISDTINRWIKF
ncbi:MAG: hypothetical protein NTY30_02180 [Candidatus Berkelbacteria bacterium]|nr:hypothetical protein [Candidatus Berkelbacteria bacterium]